MPVPGQRRLPGPRETTVVAAPPLQVWAWLFDPARASEWHPAARPARDGHGAHLGVPREFKLAPDLLVTDELLGISTRDRVLTTVMTGPQVLAGCVGRIRVLPVTDTDASFVEWSLDLRAASVGSELQALLRNVLLRDGLLGLALATAPGSPAASTTRPPLQRDPRSADPDEDRDTVTARVMRAARRGGPEVLCSETVELPLPDVGEVRIAQRYSGVNFIDLACLAGTVGMMPLPGIPGLEGVGTVDRTGAGVTDLALGDRVGYVGPPVGSYSSHRLLPREVLVRLPDELPDDAAAAMLLKGTLAGLLLNEVHSVQNNETVAVLSAAGGVGQILVQWAAALGARVIAIVSGREKVREVRALGAWAVVDRAEEDFAAALLRLTDGRGVDLLLDGVGRATLNRSLSAVRQGGHVVNYGTASGAPEPLALETLAARSLTLSRPNYAHYAATAPARSRLASRLFDAIATGRIAPATPTILPLTDAVQALQMLESGRSTGSIVLDCRY